MQKKLFYYIFNFWANFYAPDECWTAPRRSAAIRASARPHSWLQHLRPPWPSQGALPCTFKKEAQKFIKFWIYLGKI